jgi:hypothetical protein
VNGQAAAAGLSSSAESARGSADRIVRPRVDAAATSNGQYLYVQTGKSGIVDEFTVGTNGSLSAISNVTVPWRCRRRRNRLCLT